MGQVGAVDVAAQPLPVLRLVVGLDRPVVEVIELLDVLFERLRTAYGQFRVVGIGAFGRSVALEPDRGDRYVGVGAYGVDRILDFLQFRRIAAVVGIDDGLVDGEVDECRSVDREDLHRIGFRPDVDEARDVDERGFVEAQHVALFVEQRAAAPVVLPVEDERGSVHPRLVGAAGAVCDGIRLFRGPEVPPPIDSGEVRAVARIVEIASAAVDAHRRQFDRIPSVEQAGSQYDRQIGIDLQTCEVEIHLHGHRFAAVRHPGISDRNALYSLCVERRIQAHQSRYDQ